MKAITILAAAALLLLGAAGVSGQSLFLDHVDGLNGTGALDTGVPITLYIGMTAGPENIWGITSGFQVYSNNGAQWTGTSGEWVDVTTAVFEQLFTTPLSPDGQGADTIGFSGFRMFTNGIPAGFEGIAFAIHIGPIDEAYNGTSICLDSCYYPPSGLFKWVSSVGDVFPSWDGPHCWTVGEAVPQVTCPGDVEVDLCGPDTLCYEFSYSNTDQISASAPAYIEGNTVCVPVLEAGLQTITLTAGAAPSTAECSFTVTANFDQPPVVDVDPAFEFQMCDPGQSFSFGFAAGDPEGMLTDISSSMGSISTEDNQYYMLTFSPGATGTYDITITATDACGHETVATTVVTVTEGPIAEITCPESFEYAACEPGTLEISVPISPAGATVTVDNGTYDAAAGILSYDFAASEIVVFNIDAETECGLTECSFAVTITVGSAPEIACPGDQTIVFCEPGPACLGIPIQNADQVTSNIGSYNNGQFCLDIVDEGQYAVELTATNDCGTANCQFVVTAVQDCPEQTTTVEPDSIPVHWAYQVEDRMVHVYLGNLVGENGVADVDLSTLTVNGASGTASVIPNHPDYAGAVIEIVMPIYNFIEIYMPAFNLNTVDYTVAGAFNDGSPISETGMFQLQGLLVGDLNMDGSVDISDLVMMSQYFFQQGDAPVFLTTADIDRNGQVDISDLIGMVQILFGNDLR